MNRNAPLPYPLAGSDPRTEAAGRAGEPSSGRQRGRVHARAVVAASLTVSLVLLVAVGWLVAERSADQAEIESLVQQRDEAEDEAQLYRAAAESAVATPVEDQQAFSTEMVIASEAVGRFLQDAQFSPSPVSARQLVREFFQTNVRTTAWLTVPGNGPRSTGVLARVDRPAEPSSIWVSRRSLATADPSVPARTNCLRLDIPALLRSAAALRPYGTPTESAPLRWWADVYRFVPAAFCGMVSSP